MVGDWILRLYRDVGGTGDKVAALKWATDQTLGLNLYDPSDPAESYSEIYTKAFAHDPEEGRHYIQREIDKKSPDLGYYILAQMISNGPSRLILTTNFDNHALDALSSVSVQYPLVVGHEVLAGYVQARPTRPTVVKLHRDLFFGIRNSIEETSKMDAGLSDLVKTLCKAHPLIVIGYGGNDGSLMDVLLELEPNAFPGGLYWCWYEKGVPPSERVVRLLRKQNGIIVPIEGFNELMYHFWKELSLESPDKPVVTRHEARRELIGEGLLALQKEKASEDKVLTGLTADDNDLSVAKQAIVKSASTEPSEPKSWWQWQLEINSLPFEEREKAYDEAIKALPGNFELASNFASFLNENRKNYDRAEPMYRRALALEPGSANATGNFATFLWSVRKDYDQAEETYGRALALDPNHSNNIGNFANFLWCVRGDNVRAREMYDRALALTPNDVIKTGNFAGFLLSTGSYTEGLQMLEAAERLAQPLGPQPLDAELAFYRYALGPEETRKASLAALHRLIVEDGVRTGNWTFDKVIERANSQNHPEASWLVRLANVLGEQEEPSVLDAWKAWQNAKG